MAHYDLTAFADSPWTQADETRPAVKLSEVPAELSERGQRVLAGNAKLRGIYDESSNGFNGDDSRRAYSLCYWAGRCGLSKEDAARLLADLYSRPGKKKLHRSKLGLTLRAWAKGREEAEREEAGYPEDTTAAPQSDALNTGADPRERRKCAEDSPPYELLPAGDYLQASFAGATRLVERIGLTECGVGLVTASGGDGKSLLMQNLMCGWTGAKIPLADALPAARPLRILGFQVENAPGMEQERLRKILDNARPPDGLFLFTRQEPIRFSGPKGRPNERALERLGTTLARFAPVDLVVFDPLVYLHEAEENSLSEMMRWLVPLREVCRRAGAAILVVHHAGWAADGEDARGRGSTAIRAWSDFELALRAQTKSGRVLHRLNLVKTNFASRWKDPISLELDPDTLRFYPVDETGALCSPESLIAWMLEDHGGLWSAKRADLYTAICKHFGCEERTAREAIKRAKDKRLLLDQGQRKPLEVVANSQETLI